MDLSLLKWIKVVTDSDKTKWAYTRQRIREMDNVVDENGVTIFPLGFKCDNADKPEEGSIIALTQRAKLTHIVEVLDQKSYNKDAWCHRFVKVLWWNPELEWDKLPHKSVYFGFDPILMDGAPHLIENLSGYKERWNEEAGGFEAFKQYLLKNLT